MFDLNAFRKAKFKPREAELTLEGLQKAGLGDGRVIVRGLTSLDIAAAEEAASKGKLLTDIVHKLVDAGGKQKAAALLEGVGISADVPAALAKRYEHVRAGLVEPQMDLSDVVKLADCFPIEFAEIANKIMALTGMGKEAEVKRRGSGDCQTLEPA